MKRGRGLVLGVVLLISLLGVVSAFGIDSFQFNSDFNCSDYGIQCGFASIVLANGSTLVKECGICSSNATNKGTDLSSRGITNDFIGTSRPQGLAWDIGAYEYV